MAGMELWNGYQTHQNIWKPQVWLHYIYSIPAKTMSPSSYSASHQPPLVCTVFKLIVTSYLQSLWARFANVAFPSRSTLRKWKQIRLITGYSRLFWITSHLYSCAITNTCETPGEEWRVGPTGKHAQWFIYNVIGWQAGDTYSGARTTRKAKGPLIPLKTQ